ncbi:unnamed protein product [Owenia fusiformis]|uniref:Fibronectin type-III domain-containing protein n=1 Tax=Owenia fusiformis TaxID=6347 RepID=A0A8S4NWB9_OWEFU|nr:unnamed protein product [Owenia fusiformis]
MPLNWVKGDYFAMLMHTDKRAHGALEMLVDDLHAQKDSTISHFLCHSGSEDFLWGLVKLIGNDNPRVAGNSAYIIGTIAESEIGCVRIMGLLASTQPEAHKILSDLTRMLTFDDSESVMNAAGTMGTLAESHEGREWMLGESCLDDTITHITALLNNENMWTASNAALVLARLTIAEEGCSRLLEHKDTSVILSKIVMSLGVDEAGRGMNAAFAIGRMCDMEEGRTRLLKIPESERMISSLAKMLCCNDTGASKNACFALSCLATNKDGHARLLNNAHSEEVLRTLATLLCAEDGETGWFAAMTLRTLASQPVGCLRLREHKIVIPALLEVEKQSEVSPDLLEEVVSTLEILKRLSKPPPPSAEVQGPTQIELTWAEVTTKSGFNVKYIIYDGNRAVYQGKELSHTFTNLAPYTTFNFRLRASTTGDDSPCSDPVTVTTEESVPEAPTNLRFLGSTTTQLKVGWEPPENSNGQLKNYFVYQGNSCVDHTTELSAIISGLHPNTTYEVHVCASTSKGKGPKASMSGSTSELGAHAPAKPTVHVIGRNELKITWDAPEVPLGRISKYEVTMNGKVVYSGNAYSFSPHRLTPDTEYVVTVAAITNEGRCESKPSKKRTAKDEFDESTRPPLYPAPTTVRHNTIHVDDGVKTTKSKKKKSHPLTPDGTKLHNNHVRSTSAISKPRSAPASMHKKSRKNKAKDDTNTPVLESLDLTRPQSASSSESANRKEGLTTVKQEDIENSSKSTNSGEKHSKQMHSPNKLKSESTKLTVNVPKAQYDNSHSSKSKDMSQMAQRHLLKPTSSSEDTDPEVTVAKKKHKNKNREGLKSPKHLHELDPHKHMKAKNDKMDVLTKMASKYSTKSEKIDKTDNLVKTESQEQSSKDSLHRHKISSPEEAPPQWGIEQSTATKQFYSNMSRHHGKLPPEGDTRPGLTGFEIDPSWLAQAQKHQDQELNRQFSTSISLTQTGKASRNYPSTQQGYGDIDLPAPKIPHRTNTFLGAHRPILKRNLEKPTVKSVALSNTMSTHQWQPDFPTSQVQHSVPGKGFVPMQCRTQPLNLPGHVGANLRRGNTNLNVLERNSHVRQLEALARSQTQMDPFGNIGGSHDPNSAGGPSGDAHLGMMGVGQRAPPKLAVARDQTSRPHGTKSISPRRHSSPMHGVT